MGALFSTPKMPAVPAPIPQPQIEQATVLRNSQDRRYAQGRASTILTSDSGLPNLGSTSTPSASGSTTGPS